MQHYSSADLIATSGVTSANVRKAIVGVPTETVVINGQPTEWSFEDAVAILSAASVTNRSTPAALANQVGEVVADELERMMLDEGANAWVVAVRKKMIPGFTVRVFRESVGALAALEAEPAAQVFSIRPIATRAIAALAAHEARKRNGVPA